MDMGNWQVIVYYYDGLDQVICETYNILDRTESEAENEAISYIAFQYPNVDIDWDITNLEMG